MTIILTDSEDVEKIDTGTHPHGTINPGPWDEARVTQRWFGTTGEVTFTGGKSGRELRCWLWLTGYASHDLLQAGIVVLNDEQGTSGTLSIGSLEFPNTIFNGFTPEEDPWYDGSGVNGWQVKGTLSFRQVKS